jgi:hypothetical protein
MKSKRPTVADRLRSIWRRVRESRVLSEGSGIDDTALPSGYAAPYRKGSRAVRNLWHLPF